ncbi:MAG: PIG-L family deacetylase [Actinobacteria bacterium]|nr:PIG-L family deacetylase [Actinomycetota bacterium]MCL6095263.1 PIG-L family deacetylase [Actinomycetota bacterium]
MVADRPSELDSYPHVALAVYAHPDDPDVSCGGTLAKWCRAGSEVHVLICTDGGKGTVDPSMTTVRLAEMRKREMAEAGEVIGVFGQHLLGHPDGELDESKLRKEIVYWIRYLRPEAVVCPDPTAIFFGDSYFNHRDHRSVGWAVLDAISPSASLPLYFPDAGPPHKVKVVYLSGTLEPNHWVDISSTIELKCMAISCHRSQLSGGGELEQQVVRERAKAEGMTAGMAYAEAFRLLELVDSPNG